MSVNLAPISGIDRLVHEPGRFQVLALLYVVESADFIFLMNQLGLTWGNLSAHITKLEEGGYVTVAHKYALENLIAGIHSENDGVRRNSIYFAGYYKIVEAEDALIAQLKKENDPSTRILIALVLYELGSEEGLFEVKDLSLNDENAKVRRMATQIYNEYLVNDAGSTAYVTE